MNELRKAFDDVDTNRSGSISRREIRRVFNYLDIRASEDEIDVVMNQMDTNGKLSGLICIPFIWFVIKNDQFFLENGKIEFEEFANVMAKSYYKKHSKSDIIEAFKYVLFCNLNIDSKLATSS